MPIRLSGMNSGLDTDTIVSALVSAYSYKKDTYTKQQTKLTWKQDAWKALNTKVYGLYTNISSMRYSSAYNLKKTTSSDTTKATVTASNTATNGTQKLNILQVAQSGYLTGGKLDRGTTNQTTLAELGFTGGDASINVDKGDGTSTTIKVNSSSTIDDVVKQLKDSGLNASFDTTNGRLFVSAKESGKAADFNLIGADANGVKALSALGLSTSLYKTDANGNQVATGAGATYEKYASYAKVDDGNGNISYLTESELSTVEGRINDALNEYKDAAKVKGQADAQIANLTTAMSSYANSYAAVQDFYREKGIDTSDPDALNRFNNAMAAKAASSGGSLIDDRGNVYNATSSKDANGNKVFAYADSEGTAHYVSKALSYTDENGVSYTKNDKGKYIAEDGTVYSGDTQNLQEHATYYEVTERISYDSKTKDADGREVTNSYNVQKETIGEGEDSRDRYYFVNDEGKKYVSDKESGVFKALNDDGTVNNDDTVTIKKNYNYEPSAAPLGNIETVNQAYKRYVADDAGGYDITDDEAKAFAANLAKMQSFEKSASDTEAGDIAFTSDGSNYSYTKLSIINEVHSTYANAVAADPTSGAAAVKDLTTSYAEKVAELKGISRNAESIMDANDSVANLAKIEDPDRLSEAVTKMAKMAVSSAEVIQDAQMNGDVGAATKMDGQDSIIKLNDVEYTNASNDISINGLTIHAQAVTGDGDENAITIRTATDTQGVYDKIKDFLSEYNNLINEMTKLFNADNAKGYEPLTDDEKDAMSDKEIEKWESKIKDSLLRNDNTLSGLLTSMTSAMSSAIEIGGKRYSLSSFGISTLGILNSATNEHYAYHIDGDEDDVNTSGKKDKLMAMIDQDPDTVMNFFQQLSSNLYKTLGDKMKSSSLSSVYTVYNDKQMEKQNKEYSTLIKSWEDKIATKEDYYYSKFTAMEKALAKLNSTQSSLGGYFG